MESFLFFKHDEKVGRDSSAGGKSGSCALPGASVPTRPKRDTRFPAPEDTRPHGSPALQKTPTAPDTGKRLMELLLTPLLALRARKKIKPTKRSTGGFHLNSLYFTPGLSVSRRAHKTRLSPERPRSARPPPAHSLQGQRCSATPCRGSRARPHPSSQPRARSSAHA